MKRALIVVSSFRPFLVADMHRARMLAGDLPRHGWEVEVLTPAAGYQSAVLRDPDAVGFFPPGLRVHEAPFVEPWYARLAGMRAIGWRAFRSMRETGDRLLASGRFDLVYFSTTTFVFFCLGRRWKRRFGVPFVLDFHDPWHRPKWRYVTTRHPIKFRAALLVAKYLERRSVAEADGIVSVSRVYLDQLLERYAGKGYRWLAPGRHICRPIGVRAGDLEAVGESPESAARSGGERRLRIVYVGAGGAIMGRAMRALCRHLRQLRDNDPGRIGGLRIELVGTTFLWRPGDPKVLGEMATAAGLGDMFVEEPERLSYGDALRRIRGADGLLVLGVDDAGYMPSKLFLYAATGLPLLACLRADSEGARHVRARPELCRLITFSESEAASGEDDMKTLRLFLAEVRDGRRIDRGGALAGFTSEDDALEHAGLFDACLLAGIRGATGRKM